MVTTRTKQAEPETGQTARAKLAQVQERLEQLQQLIDDADEQLLVCTTIRGVQLLKSRRDASDELDWLETRLPPIIAAAEKEEWMQLKDELNAKWGPLAERRKAASEVFQLCVRNLLASIPMMLEIDQEQKALLAAYDKIDKLEPGRERRAAHIPSPMQQRTNDLHQATGRSMGWMKRQLSDHLPEGGRFLSETLIDETKIEYRSEAI